MRSFFNEEQPGEDRPEHVKLTLGNAIAFQPKPRSVRSYGISIKYYDGEEPEPSKRVDYQVQLTINQYKNVANTWHLSFNKDELFLNRHEPDLVSEQLAHLAMQSLYPVEVDVNAQNEAFRGIVNHEQILKRWGETTSNIREKYIGEYTDLFVARMDKQLRDKWRIEQSLTYDMFWSVFFHPQYFSYEQNLSKDIVFEFPALPYQQLKFSGKQRLESQHTAYGTCKVEFHAASELSEPLKYKLGISGKGQMKLNAQFDLDIDGGLLKYAVVNWEAGHEKAEPKKRIRFSAYEIERKEKPETGTIAAVEDQHMPSAKKGFWKRILG